ncbi:DUF5331 domain-containing protein [Gloeothece verrucosa]|uniref:Uncharacterized protein n=1 Tax=Gloeothece verrucosa (strain PCC 7822) TaxID=497965 RepID=E0U839_GLOV7|nr:DUF5331 domain-containing protein [Gloeothece verrucosa]ADN17244.1 conserved hypothetical protein [Gloeothece verrucosa PCC 7822]
MSLSQDLKVTLKDKYLDYCQANLSWLKEFKDTGMAIKASDGGIRPPGLIILGIISVLVPEIAAFIPVFLKLNSNTETVIATLGLNVDPEKELEKRAEELAKVQELEIVPLLPEPDPDTEYLNQIRATLKEEK